MKPCRTPARVDAVQRKLNTYISAFERSGCEVRQLVPTKQPVPLSQQKIIPFGDAERGRRRGEVYSVVVHARNRQHSLPFGGANYPVDKWRVIIDALRSAGHSIASIGAPSASFHLPDTEDLRGVPLERLFDIIAAARIAIGPSSGPMHLASLCKTPHVVWAGDRFQPVIKANNKTRYETLWNPFNTPAHVILEPVKGPVTEPNVILVAVQHMLSKR